MKRTILLLSQYFSLALLLIIMSCSNNDPAIPATTEIENHVQSGAWTIVSFIDSGKDETQHFQGYQFTFDANHLIHATNNTLTYSGTWTLSAHTSGDDPAGDIDFIIQFSAPDSFQDLNEDWHIAAQSASRIELIHISGGNGGTDYLTFEKN